MAAPAVTVVSNSRLSGTDALPLKIVTFFRGSAPPWRAPHLARGRGRARAVAGAYSPRRTCKYGIAHSLVFGVLWSLSLLLYFACRVKCCWWGAAGAAAAIPMAIPHTSHSQLAEPLLQLPGRVLRHGGVAATDVLAVDPDTWDSALPRHVGQKALHVMAISSLVELNYSWTHGQADEELLCLRAEAAPDPCMACTWHATLHQGSAVYMAGTTSC